jgi:hypothetical protein
LSLGNSVETAATPGPGSQVRTVAATGGRKLSELKLVSVAPIVLTPANTAAAVQMQDQILRDLNALASRHNFALIADGGGSEPLTLRGYVLASRDKKGIRITQIWDVTDRGGSRVNRTVREQVVPAQAAKAPDLWIAAGRIDVTGMAEMAIDALNGAAPAQPSGVGTVATPAVPKASPAPPVGAPSGNLATGIGATRPRFLNGVRP